MDDIFTYLAWKGDLSLKAAPLNETDALILCRAAYFPMDGAVPEDFQNHIALKDAAAVMLADAEERRFLMENDKRLLAELASCPRFEHLELCGYRNNTDPSTEKQFSAVTVKLGDSLFISFRGTDSTLVGWKEDFNMSFSLIPSQLEAVQYLKQAVASGGRIICGGHSKGGNLAVYAAAFCGKRLQKRIDAVYNFDGPGFIKEVTQSPEYNAISGKVYKFVPQSSIIGRLLTADERFIAVISEEKGLRQHDLYSWRIVPPGRMEPAAVQNSPFMGRSLNDWIAGMDMNTRRQFFDACYEVITQTGASTLSELFTGKNALLIIKNYRATDPEARRLILRGFTLLYRAARGNIPLQRHRTDSGAPPKQPQTTMNGLKTARRTNKSCANR